MEAEKLINDLEWWSGPEWLQKDESNWPQGLDEDQEVHPEEFEETNARVNITRTHEESEPIFNLKNYGSWMKTIRITAWILRFARNLKKEQLFVGPLKTEEMESAENYWFKYTQKKKFSSEIQLTERAIKIKDNSPLSNVAVVLDGNGILRIDTRICFHAGVKDFINPIVLDSCSPMTTLIIADCHRRALHRGLGDTSKFRARYWTQRARRLIKTFVAKCVICCRVNAKLMTQAIGLLPADRINRAEPFQIIGVDFAGPLYSRNGKKVYIALFTCTVVRAVHLELVSDLTAEKFILAFKRLISRRGIPSIVYSDNAKTFKRTEKDLAFFFNEFSNENFQGFLSKLRIQWKFIVELAPWWGGFWERLVKTVKLSLKKVLGRSSLDFEELSTVLTEVEAV